MRQIVRAMPISEGAGVIVQRAIGTSALRHLDPFLLLDHFSSDNPNDYLAGFPDHPHRGFITLTYMLDGHMLHQDSMGNRGDLRAGGIQWMKAASGVIHSEMPQQTDGLMRGFQLWVNLPATEKMSDPEYQEFSAEFIPVIESEGCRVKLICGEYRAHRGPITDPHTHVLYLDAALAPNHAFAYRVDSGLSALSYVFEGNAEMSGSDVNTHSAVVFEPGEEIAVTAGADGVRLILVAGHPLNEPIVQYGPFVMNTREEVQQAFDDFNNDRLVRTKATTRMR
ncbi:MAG: pirin family protein [Acidiferrobacterales bacterium]